MEHEVLQLVHYTYALVVCTSFQITLVRLLQQLYLSAPPSLSLVRLFVCLVLACLLLSPWNEERWRKREYLPGIERDGERERGAGGENTRTVRMLVFKYGRLPYLPLVLVEVTDCVLDLRQKHAKDDDTQVPVLQ